jgi:AcrR family transcriptional regulator
MARTRANDYDDKRAALLRHSADLFARHGFTGTSINMIADACGISKALLYHYYPSKEAVLFDLLEDHLRVLVEVLQQAVAGAEEADRLFTLASALLEAYRGADAEHQVQIANLKLLPDDKQSILKGIERELVEIVSEAIAAALPEVANRRDLLMPLTMSFFAMLNWHYLWFREGKGLTRDQYARMVTDLILTGAATSIASVEAMGSKRRTPAGKSAPSRTA